MHRFYSLSLSHTHTHTHTHTQSVCLITGQCMPAVLGDLSWRQASPAVKLPWHLLCWDGILKVYSVFMSVHIVCVCMWGVAWHVHVTHLIRTKTAALQYVCRIFIFICTLGHNLLICSPQERCVNYSSITVVIDMCCLQQLPSIVQSGWTDRCYLPSRGGYLVTSGLIILGCYVEYNITVGLMSDRWMFSAHYLGNGWEWIGQEKLN